MTKGTPPAPSDEATANIAESTEVSSRRSLAMEIHIAYDGPTPTATPLTPKSNAGSSVGQTEAEIQAREATDAPPTIIDDGFKWQHLQMQGAITRRLALGRSEAFTGFHRPFTSI